MNYLHIDSSPDIKEYLDKLIDYSFINPDITKDDCFKFIDRINKRDD